MNQYHVYDDLWQLLCATREDAIKHKSQIISEDDPIKLLLVWRIVESNFQHKITLRCIRQGNPSLNNTEIQKILQELLKTYAGRTQIAEYLSYNDNEDSCLTIFERLANLKAFL